MFEDPSSRGLDRAGAWAIMSHNLKVCWGSECEAAMIWAFALEMNMNMKMFKWLGMNLAWVVLDELTN